MGRTVENVPWRGPAARADEKVFLDLVHYAKSLGPGNQPTFFYSPVLRQVEAVHYSGRKTFPGALPPALVKQWESARLIQVLGRSCERSWGAGGEASLVAFEISAEGLACRAAEGARPGSTSLESWIHKVFPQGWRCPLDPQDAQGGSVSRPGASSPG